MWRLGFPTITTSTLDIETPLAGGGVLRVVRKVGAGVGVQVHGQAVLMLKAWVGTGVPWGV